MSSVSVLEHAPFIIEYVIVCVPGPAVIASNVPLMASVIPVPLQTPPGSTPVKLKAASFSQTGETGVIVASTSAST